MDPVSTVREKKAFSFFPVAFCFFPSIHSAASHAARVSSRSSSCARSQLLLIFLSGSRRIFICVSVATGRALSKH